MKRHGYFPQEVYNLADIFYHYIFEKYDKIFCSSTLITLGPNIEGTLKCPVCLIRWRRDMGPYERGRHSMGPTSLCHLIFFFLNSNPGVFMCKIYFSQHCLLIPIFKSVKITL